MVPLPRLLGMLSCLAVAAAPPVPAVAHPHVWVTVEATVQFDNGAITAIRHAWTFDELYTAMAIEGLDKNKDGKYDREELAELAKVNMDGLKEFAYFTFPVLAGKDLKLGEPSDSYLEHTNELLSLHFTVPLAEPVPAAAKGFQLSITDPSYFIAFDLAKTDPVRLGEGAPKGCRVRLGVPGKETADSDRLAGAFAEQLGALGGVGGNRPISVACPSS